MNLSCSVFLFACILHTAAAFGGERSSGGDTPVPTSISFLVTSPSSPNSAMDTLVRADLETLDTMFAVAQFEGWLDPNDVIRGSVFIQSREQEIALEHYSVCAEGLSLREMSKIHRQFLAVTKAHAFWILEGSGCRADLQQQAFAEQRESLIGLQRFFNIKSADFYPVATDGAADDPCLVGHRVAFWFKRFAGETMDRLFEVHSHRIVFDPQRCDKLAMLRAEPQVFRVSQPPGPAVYWDVEQESQTFRLQMVSQGDQPLPAAARLTINREGPWQISSTHLAGNAVFEGRIGGRQ